MHSALYIFIAYYIVGIIVFFRDLKEIEPDDPGVRMFSQQMDSESDAYVVWLAAKLFMFIVFVHIPCWIFRV